MEAFAHQVTTTDHILKYPRCLITSDPGTGKTRSVIDAFTQRGGKMLVLAPLSILQASWAVRGVLGHAESPSLVTRADGRAAEDAECAISEGFDLEQVPHGDDQHQRDGEEAQNEAHQEPGLYEPFEAV